MSTVPNTNERRPSGPSLPNDWRESLEVRMRGLRNRVVWLLWLRAVAIFLILCVLATIAVAALDWWLRPSGTVGRWGLSSLLFASLAGVGVWFVWAARERRISTAVVARQLERLIPSLGDRLSSAVALLNRGSADRNPTAGDSRESELPERVVRQAAEDLEAARPERTIDRGPALRMAWGASLLVAGLIAACFWQPATASLAARRLIAPASEAAWPRRNHLELANVPERVHAGSDVEIFVRDLGGALPEDTEVLFRDSEGQQFSPSLRMSGTSAAAMIEGVRGDFSVRARGGDDDTMPWRTVHVVAAPRIETYQVRLLPPKYSGHEPQTLVGERIRVLAGTKMWIEATVAPPIVQAALVKIDRGGRPPQLPAPQPPAPQPPASPQPPAAQAGEAIERLHANPEAHANPGAERTSWPVEIDESGDRESGSRISVGPVALDRDGEFVFRWIDTEGLAGESDQRWRIETSEDAVPLVVMIEPQADLEVTVGGTVELAMTIEDDLGLSESWFEIHAVELSRIVPFELERYDDGRRKQTRRTRVRIDELISAGAANDPDPPLGPGQTIEVTGVGIDIAGQRGESTTRRWRIVSTERLRQSLADRQRAAMEQLRQAAREQTVAAEQTEAARGRLHGDSGQRRAAEDRLRAAEAAQSTAERRTADGPQSAVEELRSAVQTARDNALDAEKLESLLSEVESATEESMRPASEALDRSRQQLSADDEQAAARTMDEAIALQRQTAEALDRIVDAIRRDDARRSAMEDLAELQGAQTRLTESSRQVAGAADPRAEAARLAQQQRGLARQVESMTQQLRQLAEQQREQNPEAAAAAGEAAEALERGGADRPEQRAAVADSMRAAAAELERGREGRATEIQSEITEQLAAARQELSGGRSSADQSSAGSQPDGSSETEDPTRRFAASLEDLRGEQATLVGALRDRIDPAMAHTQSGLADRTRALAATATAPPGFSEAVADAAADMQIAAALLRRSGSEAVAVDHAEAALTRLELIAESLAGPAGDPASEPAPGDPAADAESAEQGGQSEQVPLATLRLVRGTQDFLRRRTEQIAMEVEAAEQADADPLRRARIQAAKRGLAEEQARLVARIERYAQQMAEGQANEPEESSAPIEN